MSLYYPATWESVSEDEYVFLLPSLTRQRPSASGRDAGPERYLRDALIARVHECVLHFSPMYSSAVAQGRLLVIGTIERSGVITSLALDQVLSDSEVAWRRFYAPHAASWHPLRQLWRPKADDQAADIRWGYELAVLAALDRMLGEVTNEGAQRSSPALYYPPLWQVLIASMHSGFNGAYLFRQYEFAHELLTVAAWLGHPLRRRSALMPPMIARRLVDHSKGAAGFANSTDAGRCETLIRLHAEMAGGHSWLLGKARRALRLGCALVVKPRPLTGSRLIKLLQSEVSAYSQQ